MDYDRILNYPGNYCLIMVILILALVCVLISLTSAMKILTSKGASCILSSIRSMTSGLAPIILIMVIVVSVLIIILILLCLWWWIFWFLLRLLTFASTSRLGLFRTSPFKRLQYLRFVLVILEWTICEYKPVTVVPLANVGNAAAGGLYFLIICSNSLAFLAVTAQSFSVIRCICPS